MVEDKIKKELERIKSEQEVFSTVSTLPESTATTAFINLENHEIVIKYNPSWEKKHSCKSLEKYVSKKNINDVLVTLVKDVFYHEIGHRGGNGTPGCPRTPVLLAEQFFKPIEKTTELKSMSRIANFANYMTDFIDNTLLKKTSSDEGVTDMTGFYLFLKEQGLNNGIFGKMYEAHTRLNIALNGDRIDKRLLEDHIVESRDVGEAISRFFERTGISGMTETLYQGSTPIVVKNREKIRDYLANEENWEEFATIYSEEFYKFFNPEKLENHFGSGSSQQQKDSQDGNGEPSEGSEEGQSGDSGEESLNNDRNSQDDSSKGEDSFENGEQGSDGKDSSQSDGPGEETDEGLEDLLDKLFPPKNGPQDGFCDELDTDEVIRQILRGRMAGNKPGWMGDFEYLKNYYEMKASDKLFDLVTDDVPAKRYPLIGIGSRAFDYEEDDINKIAGLDLDEDGGLDLSVSRFILDVIAKVSETVSDHPDLVLAMLDTSGSMQWDMPEGDGLGEVINPDADSEHQWRENSRYDVSLTAYFMLVNRLSELGVYEADAYFARFSGQTVLSRGLLQSMYEALHPEFGGTYINLEKIEDVISRKDQLVCTLSDGEIDNAQSVAQKLIEVSEYNPVFHIQIGKENGFTEKLREKEIYVKTVKSEKDLYDFVIDMTELVYSGKSIDIEELKKYRDEK